MTIEERAGTAQTVSIVRPKLCRQFRSFDPNVAAILGCSTQTVQAVSVVRPKRGSHFGLFDPNCANSFGRSIQTL
jgi:hypothetical protein